MIALLIRVALAQDPGLVEERLAVERAATAVAEARSRGASRADVAELMATYRAAAERLLAHERATTPPVDRAAVRLAAIRDLTEALAAGREAADARAALEAWLGDPFARMSLLEQALTTAPTVGSKELERALVVDVVDQTNALHLLLTYDAAGVRRDIERSNVRLASLRRDVPGQASSIDEQVEAVRLEGEIAERRRNVDALVAARARCDAIRARAATLLEKP